MHKEALLHWESVHVRGYDVDRRQFATIPSLIQMMHEAAMQHVQRLRLSAKELTDHDLGWALYQQWTEVLRLPKLGDRLKVLTHPSGKERLFTFRDFHLYDDQENLLARATSTWFLMNIKKRRIARYPAFVDEVIVPSNDLTHLPRANKVRKELSKVDFRQTFTVRYHDLDFNGHLSNFFYARWMLDTLPFHWLDEHQLQSFNLQFIEECLLGDEIGVEVHQKSPGFFIHRMIKNGKEIAIAESQWH